METALGVYPLLPERCSFFVGLKKQECPVDVKRGMVYLYTVQEYDESARREEWQSAVQVFA